MESLTGKNTGDDLEAAEWNQLPQEIQNIIIGLGQTLTNSDLNQLGKAIAGYVANGSFYTDSGTANAYILGVVGSKQAPPAYTDGMKIRFVAANANTGASTVNVAGLGVKSIKIPGGLDPAAGDVFNRTELVFDASNDRFEITSNDFTKLLITENTFLAKQNFDDSVGIGTETALGSLHIKNTSDNATPTNVNNSILLSHQSGTYTDGNLYGMLSWARANSNGTNVSAFIGATMGTGGAAGDLVFGAGDTPTEHLRLKGNGTLLFGTTDSIIFNESAGEDGVVVDGDGGNIQAKREDSPSLLLNRIGSDGPIQNLYKGGSNVGNISVTTTGASINSLSDYRLKKDEKPMTGALDQLMQLKPLSYTWKINGEKEDGFFAHEVQQIVPIAVTGEKDGTRWENGEEVPDFQTIDMSKLMPLSIAAQQETATMLKETAALLQNALKQIESLKSRVAELENK